MSVKHFCISSIAPQISTLKPQVNKSSKWCGSSWSFLKASQKLVF